MRRGQWFGRVNWGRILVGVLVAGGAAERAHALPAYLAAFESAYPAAVGSKIDACNLCHSSIPQLNPYGTAFNGAGPLHRQEGPADMPTGTALRARC
jgi:hypothetical protein